MRTSRATSSSSPSDAQLEHFPARYMRGLVDEMDHQVSVIATTDPHALDSVDPARIMRRGETMRPLLDWRGEKENAGRFTLDARPLRDRRRWRPRRASSWRSTGSRSSHACFLDSEDPLARWREVGERLDEHARAAQRAADRARARRPARTSTCGSTLGEQRRWLGGQRAQHPQLRDLHQPGLARHRGLDPLQPAALPLRQPRQGHPPRVRRRARHGGERRGERARAEGDDRDRGRRQGRRVLADRPALLADHALHGPDALRRERRRRVRQHPHRARARLPGRLRRRPRDARARGLGAARLQQLERPHRHRLDHRPRPSPPRLRDGAERVIYRDGEFVLD